MSQIIANLTTFRITWQSIPSIRSITINRTPEFYGYFSNYRNIEPYPPSNCKMQRW